MCVPWRRRLRRSPMHGPVSAAGLAAAARTKYVLMCKVMYLCGTMNRYIDRYIHAYHGDRVRYVGLRT